MRTAVTRDRQARTLKIDQRTYVQSILRELGLGNRITWDSARILKCGIPNGTSTQTGREGRKSISGSIILMSSSPLSWSSKQQCVVVSSSCEAGYLTSTHCTHEVLWFGNLFAELGFPQYSPITIFCDNQGAIGCTHDPHAHIKMKHIDLRALHPGLYSQTPN